MIQRRDFDFFLYEFSKVQELTKHDRFSHIDRDQIDAIMDTALQIAEGHFAPHAAKLDANEPTWDGETVHVIDEVKPALEAFADAGFMAGLATMEDGGMQLPNLVGQAYMALFYATNTESAGYPFLTMAAANLIAEHATAEQKQTWLEPMLAGKFFGTMCLSESDAGSSLADLQTQATPREDGDYDIKGAKMWISGGEHELTENIVHLVLAKLPGAPAGVKGISLFIVPRYRLDEAGNSTDDNGVRMAGVNHKMGYRGIVNCALNFGEDMPSVGYLVGKEHHGLRYMFHMMNEARIGVGIGAASLGYAGYRYSLEYAKERPQGRAVTNRDPASPQIPIIEHTDVKRMLLAQKAYVEGGLALGFYAARIMDEITLEEDEEKRGELRVFLDLLTPIVKTWPSEFCLEANKLAIQVLGGCGYTREYPVERLYRTNRLNSIHEGTNGIQSLDLLGRKVPMNGGAGLQNLGGRIQQTIGRASEDAELVEFADMLKQSWAEMVNTTMTLSGKAMAGEIEVYLANSWEYLTCLGHIVISWIWLEQAIAARTGLASTPDDDFYQGKLAACAYFFRHELPKTERQFDLLRAAETTCLDMKVEYF